MSQKTLPFKFEENRKERGITSLGGFGFIFRLSPHHGFIKICDGPYSGKRVHPGVDRLSGDHVVNPVESFWRGLY